jgi:peptidoglycan endopeptidase LytF
MPTPAPITAPEPTPTPETEPAPTPTPTPDNDCQGFYHTIVAGDSLYMLAKRYNLTLDEIMQANPHVDLYNLRIGGRLCIPVDATVSEPESNPCEGILHTVVRGDTLYKISLQHNVSLDDIMRLNPDLDPYDLRVGMEICLPRGEDDDQVNIAEAESQSEKKRI